MQRAFTLLTVKSIDEEKRTISGVASTPSPDRVGDVVEPLGARFKMPMPLLLYHESNRPVGTVDFAQSTKTGIPFRASLPVVKEPGIIQDRVNEAWHSLKYGLVGAVSIGFKPLANAVEILKDGGLRYKEWEWLELSLCAVPANPEALINSFKSMDPAAITSAMGLKQEVDAGREALIASIKKRVVYVKSHAGAVYLSR